MRFKLARTARTGHARREKQRELTILPLSIKNIVQRDEILGLVHGTRAYTTQLLHVGADAEQKSQVDTEGTDVGTSLAANPEDTEVAVVVELDKLGLVDGTDTQLTLDGRNQRRALEEGASELLEYTGKLCLAAGNLVVESHNRDILLSGTLLGLDKTCGAVNADNQTSSDLGVESTAVTSLFYAKHALHPGDDFVGRGVRGLVEVDDTRRDVALDITHVRLAAMGDRREVTGSHENCNGNLSVRLVMASGAASAFEENWSTHACHSSSAAAANRWCRQLAWWTVAR